jgi:AraC-like DNA-binding protein
VGLDHSAGYGTSRVWLTPDFSMGFHQFGYLENHYDGLAHRHGEYSIVMCTSGAMEILRGERRDTLTEGEVLIVNPGEIHRCRFGLDNSQSHGVTLIMRPSALRNVLDAMSLRSFSPDFLFTGKVRNPDAFELAGKLVQEFEQQKPGYSTMVESIVQQVLVHLFRSWPANARIPCEFQLPPQLPWLHMHRATEYMNRHGKGSFRLSDLCMDVGVSPSRFIPLFKSSSGVSPHIYYNSLLIFKARRLFQTEGSSTKEAAYMLGFRNVSHFCALFHHLTGTTPKGDSGSINDLLDPRIDPRITDRF